MIDDVTGVGSGRPQQTNQAATPNESSSEERRAIQSDASSTRPPSVEVELSEEVQRSEERAQFDEAKVRQLKEQIERGSYPIDAQRLAEQFADLEQLL